MGNKLNGVELRRAHLVPSSVFASPDAVLETADLSRTEMIRILRRWEFDLRGPSQPLPPEQNVMLDRVRDVLAELERGSAPGARAPLTRH